VFTEEIAGIQVADRKFGQFKSRNFGGFVSYIQNQQSVYKKLGIIHYSNDSPANTYGEGFNLETPKLELPTIMWHKSSDSTMGLTLVSDGDSKILTGTNKSLNLLYYNLIDDNSGVVVGKIFNDLKLFVIEDQELLFAMSYKSNRSWTLPNYTFGTSTGSIGTPVITTPVLHPIELTSELCNSFNIIWDVCATTNAPLTYKILKMSDNSDWTVLTDGLINNDIYIDNNLSDGVTYSYKIVAIDNDGLESASSNVEAMKVSCVYKPTTPVLSPIEVDDCDGFSIDWTESTSNNLPITYNIYRDVNGYGFILFKNQAERVYSDQNLSNGATYSYYVVAVDSTGEVSANSETKTQTVNCGVKPEATIVNSVELYGDVCNRFTIDWKQSTSVTPVTYRLERNEGYGWSLLIDNITDIIYNDDDAGQGLRDGMTYDYRVFVVDENGLVSDASNVKGRTVGCAEVVTPTLQPIQLDLGLWNRFRIFWNNTATSGQSMSWEIYRKVNQYPWNHLTTVSGVTSYIDTNVSDGNTYGYYIVAVVNGVESANSNSEERTADSNA
jgi:fibronectin type 3 domain-containing protein